MAQLCVQYAVPLPCRPILAKKITLGEEALPDVLGEVFNLTNRTPDGRLVYAVACAVGGGAAPAQGERQAPWEGWLAGDAVRPLDPAEAAAVPAEALLSERELLRRTTFVNVVEDWISEIHDPSTLALRTGELLQLGTARRDGWAYGWSMDSPSRRGWFPLAFVRRLEPSLGSLVQKEEQELLASAASALIEVLKSAPPPPPMQWAWEGELPAAVAESAQQFELDWRDTMAQMEAAQKPIGEGGAGAGPGGVAGGGAAADLTAAGDPASELFAEENLPEDCYPLVVCKDAFVPPKGASGALLAIQVGELIRVTSLLEASMYRGFQVGSGATMGGWFPRRNVALVSDPLDLRADVAATAPAQIGPPPLPQVPPSLLRNRRLQGQQGPR